MSLRDVAEVRAGATLIVPCKVKGCGIYFGDMHAMQGDGEIAGHTTDVSGTITAQVHVLKQRTLPGPLLLLVEADLPFLAQPLTPQERSAAQEAPAERDGTCLAGYLTRGQSWCGVVVPATRPLLRAQPGTVVRRSPRSGASAASRRASRCRSSAPART